jgi:hypothetical protein
LKETCVGQSVFLYIKIADIPVLGNQTYYRQKLASLISQCHAIINKYPEAASVLQVDKVLNDIEILADAHW